MHRSSGGAEDPAAALRFAERRAQAVRPARLTAFEEFFGEAGVAVAG